MILTSCMGWERRWGRWCGPEAQEQPGQQCRAVKNMQVPSRAGFAGQWPSLSAFTSDQSCTVPVLSSSFLTVAMVIPNISRGDSCLAMHWAHFSANLTWVRGVECREQRGMGEAGRGAAGELQVSGDSRDGTHGGEEGTQHCRKDGPD